MKIAKFIFLTCCLALCACGDRSESPSATAEQAPYTMAADAMETIGLNGILHATYPPVSCESGVVATLRWDVTDKGITAVEVWVQGVDKPALFAAGGGKGSAQTGPWTNPGTQFMLRALPDGTQLDELVIEGEPCSTSTNATDS